jgi:hypothetical protein
MTLLSTIVQVCNVLKITQPLSVFNSSDANITQLLGLANAWAKEIVDDYNWAELQKEWLITLVDGQEAYPFPSDFSSPIEQTGWNRALGWPLLGPLTPQEWQIQKSALVAPTIRTEYRMKGSLADQFYVDPTPDAGDAGNILVLEYQSSSAIKPMQWTTATTVTAGVYVSNAGNNYFTVSGGTTGPNAPVHTSGVVSDGGVSWTYLTTVYDTFLANTDVCLIPEHLLHLALKYRWQKENGFDFQASEQEYKDRLSKMAPNKKGYRPLNINGSPLPWFRYIDWANIPDNGTWGAP